VWDTLMGQELKVLNRHTDAVTSVAFSTDGARIVSGSHDRSVRVWDASTGEEIKLLIGHIDVVGSVSFSSDGACIVSGSSDGSVRVWDISGQEANVTKDHTRAATSALLSKNDVHTICDSRDGLMSTLCTLSTSRYIREPALDRHASQCYTGWIIHPSGWGYLMFVPPDANLLDPSNILVMPPSAASYVDFTNAAFGPQWQNCYQPS
jgi:WD40 repeat protein